MSAKPKRAPTLEEIRTAPELEYLRELCLEWRAARAATKQAFAVWQAVPTDAAHHDEWNAAYETYQKASRDEDCAAHSVAHIAAKKLLGAEQPTTTTTDISTAVPA